MRFHEARFEFRIRADAAQDISPFDLIWEVKGGTTSYAGDGISPFDLIWDIDGGTTSRLADGARCAHDDFLF